MLNMFRYMTIFSATIICLGLVSFSSAQEPANKETGKVAASVMAVSDELPKGPKPIVFGGFHIYVKDVKSKTEMVQAGMQKPRSIHQITLKLETHALSKSKTDFITPAIFVTDSKGKIDVTYTHVFRSNTAATRSYQFNLSRKPEDGATVSVIFKNAKGETLEHTHKLPPAKKPFKGFTGKPIKLNTPIKLNQQ